MTLLLRDVSAGILDQHNKLPPYDTLVRQCVTYSVTRGLMFNPEIVCVSSDMIPDLEVMVMTALRQYVRSRVSL